MACLKLFQSCVSHQETLSMFWIEWNLPTNLIKSFESLTYMLYSSRTNTDNVNILRYNLFSIKKGEVESWQLPPCEFSLQKHWARANYQCAIWKQCQEAIPNMPSPFGSGWCMENSKLVMDWRGALPAPEVKHCMVYFVYI